MSLPHVDFRIMFADMAEGTQGEVWEEPNRSRFVATVREPHPDSGVLVYRVEVPHNVLRGAPRGVGLDHLFGASVRRQAVARPHLAARRPRHPREGECRGLCSSHRGARCEVARLEGYDASGRTCSYYPPRLGLSFVQW